MQPIHSLEKLITGIRKLDDAVKVTLGPRGRNVIIQKASRQPEITKDGVTVANSIQLPDPQEQMGVVLGREGARATDAIAGDATTTNIHLNRTMVDLGYELKDKGNVYSMANGMLIAGEVVEGALKEKSRVVTTLEQKIQVATISANNDKEMGRIVGEVVDKMGVSPVVVNETITPVRQLMTYEIISGYQFNKGYIDDVFMTNTLTGEAVLLEPKVIICNITLNEKLTLDILNLLLSDKGIKHKNILIVANEYSDDAKRILKKVSSNYKMQTIAGIVSGPLNLIAVKSYGFGSDEVTAYLTDLTIYTKGQLITDTVTEEMFGSADKVISTKDSTTIIGGKGEIKDRVEELKAIKVTSAFDQEKINDRIAKLTVGAAVINISAPTDIELQPLSRQLRDTIKSTQSAVESGIVEGGGMALVSSQEALQDTIDSEVDSDIKLGMTIVLGALNAPRTQMLKNANMEYTNEPIDIATGKSVESMFEAGIVDSLKVTTSTLEKAISISSQILTSSVVIVEIEPETEKSS